MADDNTLWVGGLTEEVTEDHLYELFLQAGPLLKVIRPKEKDGSSKKFAFVEFTHAESVPYAIQIMDGIRLFNQHLRLKSRTGSQHDGSARSDSPSSAHHSDPRGYRGGGGGSRGNNSGGGPPDYHRSRSYQGHSQKADLSRSFSGEERRGGHPLSQGFNMAAYSPSNMQPQSYEERRNRLLHKQNMSLQGRGEGRGQGHNYAHSFSGYGQQSPSQPQQQWYLNNY